MRATNRKSGRESSVWAELSPRPCRYKSSGFDERLQMRGNLRRRKLIEPVFVTRGHELPFLDCEVLPIV
jgi:transposase